MASKTSFDVINTDRFLDMPATARLLFFDLSVRSDSNGIVKCPRAIARATGAALGDLDLLVQKGFVQYAENGFCVRW